MRRAVVEEQDKEAMVEEEDEKVGVAQVLGVTCNVFLLIDRCDCFHVFHETTLYDACTYSQQQQQPLIALNRQARRIRFRFSDERATIHRQLLNCDKF